METGYSNLSEWAFHQYKEDSKISFIGYLYTFLFQVPHLLVYKMNMGCTLNRLVKVLYWDTCKPNFLLCTSWEVADDNPSAFHSCQRPRMSSLEQFTQHIKGVYNNLNLETM